MGECSALRGMVVGNKQADEDSVLLSVVQKANAVHDNVHV